MIEVYKILTGKYDPTYPAFYIATLIAPPGQPTEIVHISSQVWFMQIQLYG